MLGTKYLPVVLRQVLRNRARSLLTIGGVAVAMFLFCGVQALQSGAEAATRESASDQTLIVYRKDRFCPFASRLPQFYEDRIRRVPGVASVVPIKIVVNNCRTSLDVVTFRGVPADAFTREYVPALHVTSGSVDDWQRRSDAVLLGETLAARRGLKPGDRFDAAGVTAYVAGVFRSDEPQHQNVAYAHLSFIQFAAGSTAGGIVTQFNVRVADPSQMETVAQAIDAEFAADQEPTRTRSEKAFVAQAAKDVLEIVGFTRWLGIGALAAVLGLVANAIVLAVQDRIREHAVLQTLGFTGGLITRLVLAEGAALSLCGGLVGTLTAFAVLRWGRFSLSVDGTSIGAAYGPGLVLSGLGIAAAIGVLAGLVPAIQAGRREIVECFRAV